LEIWFVGLQTNEDFEIGSWSEAQQATSGWGESTFALFFAIMAFLPIYIYSFAKMITPSQPK
jgi:hypothetical protein